MCSIVGYKTCNNVAQPELVSKIFDAELWNICKFRGRDSWGVTTFDENFDATKNVGFGQDEPSWGNQSAVAMLCNFRATPTNEFVDNMSIDDLKQNQQPYNCKSMYGVHNGTIYNDNEILKDCTDRPTPIDSYAVPYAYAHGIQKQLKGGMSTAVIDSDIGMLTLYHNYNPLHLYLVEDSVWVFCSMPLEAHLNSHKLKYQVYDIPYYSGVFISNVGEPMPFEDKQNNDRKAVVCLSGGLDSTVAATVACRENDEVWLAHFDYGCKATNSEIRAIHNITEALRKKFPDKQIHDAVIDMSFLKKLGGSTLTDSEAEIGVGKAAVEKCIDWVPARNTAFFGLLASFCDRYDIGNIYAGLNLEESGAYPDNSVSFYKAFEQVLKSGSQARPSIRMPLGNLMKHEIAKLGLEIGAPIEYSWSCYHDGDVHCGNCGPCYLRRKAFHMNGVEDVIPYQNDYEGMDPKWKKGAK